MRKKDEIKLGIISKIDEKLIDEATDTRILLLEKMKSTILQARKKWIKIGAVAASFALIFAMFLIVILPILPTNSIPVYRGMTIRREAVSLSQSKSSYNEVLLLSSSDLPPANFLKNEHQKPNEEQKKDIEEIVDIEIQTDDEVKYYVEKEETFILEIHIDNPKDYEIQSFTLNGKKYANYMFKEGSTMELLLLEVTAPATSGYTEYTIDAIKYIDGTEIKDVDMSRGNQSIKVGVAYGEEPSAEITAQSATPTTVNLSINVADPDGVIGENELSFYLSDGEKIVGHKALQIGDNTVVFDNLIVSNTYEYGVVTFYDMVDGQQNREVWLLTGEITTEQAYEISNANSTQTSISFDVTGIGNVGSVTSVSLYDATTNELVQTAGPDTRSFEGLYSGRTYHVYVDFTYTAGDEKITDRVVLSNFATKKKVAPTLTFTTAASDHVSVTYAVDVTDPDSLLTVTKVEFFKGTELIAENGTAQSGKFEGLLSNNTYTVKVTYTYDLNDGQGLRTDTVTKEITTVAKKAPALTFTAAASDQVSVTYAVSVSDPDNLASITKVELFKGTELIAENGTAQSGKFEELLSDNTYTVKVTYTYDLNDGQGLHTDTVTKEITTAAKTAPTLSFDNTDITDSAITGSYHMADIDGIGSITAVALYQNGAKVQSNAEKALSFAGLSYYTAYQVVVSYTYDLNDGQGVQTVTATYDFKTLPYLVFNSVSVINTNGVSEGETIFLQLNITNPCHVVYQKVVINGREYPVVANSSTEEMVFCEILVGNQFEGGDTALTVEAVIAALDGVTYTIKLQNNLTANVFINGTLEVNSICTVADQNGTYVEKDYVSLQDTVYLKLTLSNKTGYTIDSVTINSTVYTSLLRLDDEHYLVKVTLSAGWNQLSLSSITYSRENINKTDNVVQDCRQFCTESSDVYYISRAEDLLKMNSGAKYYELTQDIDLAGLEWRGGDFCGVLNGKGFSIKNMTFVGTVDKAANLGLFANGTGVIKNLHMVSVRVIVSGNAAIQFGSIVAVGQNLIIDNCSVDKTSFISGGSAAGIAGSATTISNCINYATISGDSAYGIAGSVTTISNCVNYGTISGSGLAQCLAGGIVGNAKTVLNCINYGTINGNCDASGIAGTAAVVSDCINNGSVSGSSYAAGIVILDSTSTTVTTCINTGNITGYYAGGIMVKTLAASSKHIENCVNIGTVTGERSGNIFINADASHNDNPHERPNCYALNENATAEELSSKEFYINVLHFDEKIWNLDNLDIANGKYPTLR